MQVKKTNHPNALYRLKVNVDGAYDLCDPSPPKLYTGGSSQALVIARPVKLLNGHNFATVCSIN